MPFTATMVMIVEQFGFAITPWCRSASSGLISGTTSGTSSSMRNADELSTNTAPASTIAGRNARAAPAPTAPSTMSIPLNDSAVASSIGSVSPAKYTRLPTLRALASAFTCETGNRRSAKIFSISCPTAPVAPSTATLYSFIIFLPPARSRRRTRPAKRI